MWRLYRRKDKHGKLGKTWWGYASIDGKKTQRSTKHTDRRAAELVVQRWNRELADPDHASQTIGLGDALDAYISNRKAAGRAEGTLSMHRQKANALIAHFGGDLPLRKISADKVDEYIVARRDAKKHPSTIGKELGTLRGALKLARRRGLFARDPSAVMPVSWDNGYTPRSTYLQPDELRALLAVLPPHRAAHVAYIAMTGTRWAESLRAERADMHDGLVDVRGTKTELSKATVAISPLGEWLREFVLARVPEAGPMFRPWSTGSCNRDLRAACKRAKVTRVTPNDLRRTCSSWLSDAGADLEDIADILRHADTRMVRKVYGKRRPEALAARLAVLASTAASTTPATEATDATKASDNDR